MVPFPTRMLVCPACSTPNHEAAAYCLRCGALLPRPGAGGTLPGDDPPPPALLGNLPAAPLPPRNLRPGDVVDNKYRIESVLGEGGMGIVYLALDQNTSMHVVVKAIRGELAHDPDSRERIMAEGRVLAQIDHPNVVRLNAIVIENGIELYLVMQYIEGQSLDRLIERHVQARQPLPFPEALGIFRQVIMGVGAAHREGVVHRDIKPGNVLIRAKDGMVKVTDFGIAKTEDDAKAGKGKTRGIIGSLWYMAPEQVTGRRDLDKRVDIYALGILFYEMLVGSVPFDAASDYELMKMHVEAPLPSACTARSDIPPWVDAVLSRACAKDREQRFSSCEELRQVLLRCSLALQPSNPRLPPTLASPGALPLTSTTHHAPLQAVVPTAAGPPTLAVPSSRPVVSRGGLALVLGGFVVLGVVAAWWFQDGEASTARPVVLPPIPARSVQSPVQSPVRPSASLPSTPSSFSSRCSTPEDCKASTPKLAAPLCHEGVCSYRCQQGLFDCGGQCLDLRSDPKHCGSCGGPGSDCSRRTMPKGASPRCEEGRCTFICPSGTERCDQTCCAPGEQCTEGRCTTL